MNSLFVVFLWESLTVTYFHIHLTKIFENAMIFLIYFEQAISIYPWVFQLIASRIGVEGLMITMMT